MSFSQSLWGSGITSVARLSRCLKPIIYSEDVSMSNYPTYQFDIFLIVYILRIIVRYLERSCPFVTGFSLLWPKSREIQGVKAVFALCLPHSQVPGLSPYPRSCRCRDLYVCLTILGGILCDVSNLNKQSKTKHDYLGISPQTRQNV